MSTKGAVRPLSLRGVWGHAPLPQKNLKISTVEARKCDFQHYGNPWSLFSVVVFAFFFLISFLFSLMKSKETAVRGPTGGGRPLVTGFY